MWIYYYAMSGPGHQSIKDDFIEIDDNSSNEEIKEHLSSLLSDYYETTYAYWKVEKPSGSLLREKIKNMEEKVKNLQETINRLKKEQCFLPSPFPGQDRDIIQALKGKVEVSVMRKLHREGLFFTSDEVREWERGEISIMGEDRLVMLKAIKKADNY